MALGRARAKARIPHPMPKYEPIRPREGMDDDHCTDLKRLHCLVCGFWREEGGDPHHLKRGLDPRERGTGRKASDQWGVPLCRTHHDQVENVGDDDAWFAERGIDGRGIARVLWAERGNLEGMRRVIVRSLMSRGIYVDA